MPWKLKGGREKKAKPEPGLKRPLVLSCRVGSSSQEKEWSLEGSDVGRQLFSGRLGYQEDKTNVRTAVISVRALRCGRENVRNRCRTCFKAGVGYRQSSVCCLLILSRGLFVITYIRGISFIKHMIQIFSFS